MDHGISGLVHLAAKIMLGISMDVYMKMKMNQNMKWTILKKNMDIGFV